MTNPTASEGSARSGHGHSGHDHGAGANRARLTAAIVIVATVLVVEAVGAFLSGSLSLFADAGHMLSDLIGLIVALVATIVAAVNFGSRFGFERVCTAAMPSDRGTRTRTRTDSPSSGVAVET